MEAEQLFTLSDSTLKIGSDYEYTGVMFTGRCGIDDFWRITCPCGVIATFAVNGFPTVDTPHPCGKPNHWTVRYRLEPKKED